MSKDGLFLCDPEKNKECNKKECYVNGGQCSCTHHEEFAKDPENDPQCYERAECGELMYEEGETVIVPKDEYRQLVFSAHLVNCLEEMGVDNWNGYGDSYKNAEKRMEEFDK